MKDPLPGIFVKITEDGQWLKEGNLAVVFMIEKGLPKPLYALYSYTKDCWELMGREKFVILSS